MADSENGAPKVFKIKRLQIGLNVLVQFVALVVIVLFVNYLAFGHYKRWDFSRNKKYALSETTKRVLKNLQKPAKIIVFFTSGADFAGDLDALLKEYQYAARKKKIDIEVVDPYRSLTRARELVAKYKLGSNENLVILDYDGRSKFVNAIDLADYDMRPVQFGQPPRFIAFKGEQAITSALLEVSEEKQQKVYLTGGHGEPDLKANEIVILKTFLERQNLKVEQLSLMNVDKVPADAKAVLILGAQYDFSDREMKLLRDYWEQKGRLFIAFSPDYPTPHLTGFANEQGVKVDDDRILRTIALGPVTGVLRDVTGVFVEGGIITKRLKGVNTQFLGGTQSLTLPDAKKQDKVRVQALIEASEGYWGETDYAGGENSPIFFDPKKDKAPPLTIAASVEKGAIDDARVQVDSSRMIVVGSSQFLTNEGLTQANIDFALSALNWLLQREELIGIAPKPGAAFSLNLTGPQMSALAWFTVGGFAGGFLPMPGLIPGCAALLGFAMWLMRRR